MRKKYENLAQRWPKFNYFLLELKGHFEWCRLNLVCEAKSKNYPDLQFSLTSKFWIKISNFLKFLQQLFSDLKFNLDNKFKVPSVQLEALFCRGVQYTLQYTRVHSSILQCNPVHSSIENSIRGEVSQISNPVSLNIMLLPLFLEVNLCPLDHLTVFHYPELRQSQ